MRSIADRIIRKTPFYYGWVIIAVLALNLFFSAPGQTYFHSVFIDLYIKEFGWTRSAVSSLFSVATLITGLLMFLIGRLSDRFGQKKMIMIAAALLGLSCIWNSIISTQFMLFLGFLVGRLAGQGTMSLLAGTIAPHWFIRKRAFAFSMMFIGGISAFAILPPVNTWLIGLWGWSSVWRLWAGLLFLMFIPIAYLFLHDKPQDLHLLPDNQKAESLAENSNPSLLDDETRSWTLKETARTRSFWGILFCQMNLPMISTGVVFHFISIMGSKGISPATASFLISLLAVVIFPSTLLAGFLFDRMKPTHATALICFLQVAGLAILLTTTSIFGAIAYAVILGMTMGFQGINEGVLWPNYFGLKHLGSIRGLVMTGIIIASAIGPLPFGIAFDTFGGYTEIMLIMLLFPAAGIVIALLSPKPTLKAGPKNLST